MIEKYLYKLSTFNLANKPTPTFKSSVLYISNHYINQRNNVILTITKMHKFL